MSLGKAIAATVVGAIPEMFDGACERLINPKDLQCLKIARRLLLNDSGLHTEVSNRSTQKALEHYSIEVDLASYMDIWCQAIGRLFKLKC